jgi:hypothetical protein
MSSAGRSRSVPPAETTVSDSAASRSTDSACRTAPSYSYDQGLAARKLEPEELFAPETLESVVV